MTQKQAVLITGGAKRLGKGIALALAGAGYDVALHYNGSATEAKEVSQEIESRGGKCALLQADLSDAKTAKHLVTQAKSEFAHLNALVNNASVFGYKNFLDTDEAFFDTQMDVNFKAPFFLTQQFAKEVQQGAVVNMLDTFITKQSPNYFAYLLSKKLLAEFTLAAAGSLGPHIRVNGVAPGVILASDEKDADYIEKRKEANPLKKTGSVRDVAEAVKLLLDNAALTGQVLFIDGGEHTL
jgi:NAD(P)-dependent dehydrogenase (short-subunit alcohol dehydrogenase family)